MSKIIYVVFVLGLIGSFFLGSTLPVVQPVSQEIDLKTLTQRINNLESTINNLQMEVSQLSSEISDLRKEIDGNNAFDLLKKELANLGKYIAEQIANNLFSELKSSENEFQRWIGVVGETIAKNTLASILNSKMPGLVWNKKQITYQAGRKYSVSAITYFPVEIDTGIPLIGTITIARIALTMNGTVDVAWGSITNITIESLKIA